MFTGLIEEIGQLKSAVRQGEAMVLTVSCRKVADGTGLGDSIAVNGTCLTVTECHAGGFTANVTPETFRRSSLFRLKPGDRVNLERAMVANGRFGGHIVQGHVDGTGRIVSRHTEANAIIFRIAPDDPGLFRHILEKGSVTVDGISLTVVDIADTGFSISVIPHTLAQTALQFRVPGDVVNLETDIIGKYVDHLLHFREAGSRGKQAGGLTAAFLAEQGFL